VLPIRDELRSVLHVSAVRLGRAARSKRSVGSGDERARWLLTEARGCYVMMGSALRLTNAVASNPVVVLPLIVVLVSDAFPVT
jgi:hypothetical protein